MDQIAVMLEKRKKEHELQRTTELYNMCDSVLANVAKIAKEAEISSDSEQKSESDVSQPQQLFLTKESHHWQD